MAATSPIFSDPSQIQYAMPVSAPPSPAPSKSPTLEVLKILVGLLIALALIAILGVILFVPRSSNGLDLRQSNEEIARLQRESNENIARLQREQQLQIENNRQERQELLIEKHRLEDQLSEQERREQQISLDNQRIERQENLTEQHRSQDQSIQSENRERDLSFSLAQLRQQLQIEERRIQLLLEDRQIAEQNRKEERNKADDDLLYKFMEEFMSTKPSMNTTTITSKVHSLFRRFNPPQKSSLINFLYKNKLLNSKNTPLDLAEINLKDLVLNKIDPDSNQVGLQLDYNGLSLPLTNLINASFEEININQANFSFCTMMGASFRRSQVGETDFSHAELSLTDFRYANISQSIFTYAKIERASFQNTILPYARMDNANLRSTNFQESSGIETNFSQSDISNANFQYATLLQARMDSASIGSAKFHHAKMTNTDFSNSYLSDSIFEWAILTNSSFRFAALFSASFYKANVQDVDFTGAKLHGVNITSEQLDGALSIAGARLPDGSEGRNKNLVKNGDAQCTGMNDTIFDWINNGNVFINTDCVFQAKEINATLQQTIDIRRYKRLIEHGQGKVSIQMEGKADSNSNMEHVHMNVRFIDWQNNIIGPEMSSLGSTSFIGPSRFIVTFSCPPTTAELQITIVFRQPNATVDNIYVTIE